MSEKMPPIVKKMCQSAVMECQTFAKRNVKKLMPEKPWVDARPKQVSDQMPANAYLKENARILKHNAQ